VAVRFDKAAARALEASYQTPEIVHQRERVLAHLPLGESTRALDVGCGVGLLTQSIAERIGPGGSVLACDRSGVMVEETQHRCAAFEQVNAFEASVGALPLADGSVDCVAITQVLLYVDDIPTALEDLHRVLAPGGVLVVIETDWRGVVLGTAYPELAEKVFQAWDAAVPNPQLPGRMHGLLVASGFDVESVEAIPVLNRFCDVIDAAELGSIVARCGDEALDDATDQCRLLCVYPMACIGHHTRCGIGEIPCDCASISLGDVVGGPADQEKGGSLAVGVARIPCSNVVVGGIQRQLHGGLAAH